MRSEVRLLSGANCSEGHMFLLSKSLGPYETNAYVLGCEKTGEVAFIDAPLGASIWYQEVLKEHKLKPDKLLLTHSHWDHIADAAAIKEALGIKLYVHPRDQKNLIEPGSDGLPLFLSIPPIKPDMLIEEGEYISVGQLNLLVLETPGHSLGSVCFYLPSEKVIFTGDTLFKGSIGNVSFPYSSEEKMWESLQKIERLPKETTVYPGHGKSTTLKEENWLPRAKELFS